jgi:flavin reductase (DIM6/NTAB) family NADH-FMN oxidoreductase RutF
MLLTSETVPIIDGETLRRVAANFPTGVCVVTVDSPTGPHGMTLNAFTTVSLDPPQLLVCLNRASNTGRYVERAGSFTVNVLNADQADLAHRFSSRSPHKFHDISWVRGHSGGIILDGAVASMECTVADRLDAATHTVVIGAVHSAVTADRAPLVFHRGRFHTDGVS